MNLCGNEKPSLKARYSLMSFIMQSAFDKLSRCLYYSANFGAKYVTNLNPLESTTPHGSTLL